MDSKYQILVEYIKRNWPTLMTIDISVISEATGRHEELKKYFSQKWNNTIYVWLQWEHLSTYDSDTEDKNNSYDWIDHQRLFDERFVYGFSITWDNKKWYTYEYMVKRSDGVMFKKDSIDWKSIEEIKNEISKLRSRANTLQGQINYHNKIDFKS
jgi:hypothetical protein